MIRSLSSVQLSFVELTGRGLPIPNRDSAAKNFRGGAQTLRARGGAYFFARQDGNKIFLGTGHCGRHVNYLPTACADPPSVSKASAVTRISYISYIEQDKVGIFGRENK